MSISWLLHRPGPWRDWLWALAATVPGTLVCVAGPRVRFTLEGHLCRPRPLSRLRRTGPCSPRPGATLQGFRAVRHVWWNRNASRGGSPALQVSGGRSSREHQCREHGVSEVEGEWQKLAPSDTEPASRSLKLGTYQYFCLRKKFHQNPALPVPILKLVNEPPMAQAAAFPETRSKWGCVWVFQEESLSLPQSFGSPRCKPCWFSKPDTVGVHFPSAGPPWCRD